MSAIVEIAAISDATFDGRTFDALGAADKRRYRERAAAAQAALESAGYSIKPIAASIRGTE